MGISEIILLLRDKNLKTLARDCLFQSTTGYRFKKQRKEKLSPKYALHTIPAVYVKGYSENVVIRRER